jgi:hypothetical protein
MSGYAQCTLVHCSCGAWVDNAYRALSFLERYRKLLCSRCLGEREAARMLILCQKMGLKIAAPSTL